MVLRKFSLLVFALISASQLHAEINLPPGFFPPTVSPSTGNTSRSSEVYDQLKLYRNYYRLDSVEAPAHHFWIEFQLDGNTLEGNTGPVQNFRVRISASSLDEINALTPTLVKKTMQPVFIGPVGMSEDIPGAWNETLVDVPTAYTEWTEAITKKLLEVEPEAKSIRVQYAGSFGKIRVSELIPGTVSGESPFGRVGILGEMKFRVSSDLSEITQVGFPSLSYGELLPLFGSDPVASPRFLDFQIAPELLGKSLTQSYQAKVAPLVGTPVVPAFEEERAKLESSILKSAAAVIKETFADPIATILATEDPGVLPANFDQYVSFELDLYARADNFLNQKEAHLPVRFRVRDALSPNGARVETEWKLGGRMFQFLSILRLTATGKESSLTLLAMHPDDGTCGKDGVPVETKSLTLKFDTAIYSHQDLVAIPYLQELSLPSALPQDQTVRLPGIDGYASVDVYVLGGLKHDPILR